MIVFSNHRLGPAAELLVSAAVAESMLRETAEAASSSADDRWERELVRWLDDLAIGVTGRRATKMEAIDVSALAWSPEHFERQRRFVISAIEQAARTSEHARALARWAAMIQAHPRDSVQVGRRWNWQPTA